MKPELIDLIAKLGSSTEEEVPAAMQALLDQLTDDALKQPLGGSCQVERKAKPIANNHGFSS